MNSISAFQSRWRAYWYLVRFGWLDGPELILRPLLVNKQVLLLAVTDAVRNFVRIGTITSGTAWCKICSSCGTYFHPAYLIAGEATLVGILILVADISKAIRESVPKL